MKKLLVVALAFFTITGFAQRHNEDKKREMLKERISKQATPEDRALLDSKRMTLNLDLSTAQQEQVKNALTAHYTETQSKRADRKKSELKPTEEERKQMKIASLDAKIALKAKMKSILNAEQYAKYSQMMERRRGKKGPRGRR